MMEIMVGCGEMGGGMNDLLLVIERGALEVLPMGIEGVRDGNIPKLTQCEIHVSIEKEIDRNR